jgi:hypothetical protein
MRFKAGPWYNMNTQSYCDLAELVSDDSQLESGVRSWAVDKLTAKALWDLSERLTDLKWPK